MNQHQLKYNPNIVEISTADLSELIARYDIAQVQLHQCAAHLYGEDEALDAEVSDKELSSLAKQEDILLMAASAPVKSDIDIKNILQLWRREQPAHEDDMTASDRLILSLYKHYDLG